MDSSKFRSDPGAAWQIYVVRNLFTSPPNIEEISTMATNKIFIFSTSELLKKEIAKILVNPLEVEIYQATVCYSALENFTNGNKCTRDYPLVIFDSFLNPVSIQDVYGLFVLAPKTSSRQKQNFHWLNFNVAPNSIGEINLKAQILKIFREVFPHVAVKEEATKMKVDVKKEALPLPTMRILVTPPALKNSADGDIKNKVKVKAPAASLTLPNTLPKPTPF